MYSSTLSLTSTLVGVGAQHHSSGVNGTNFTGGWVGARADLEGCGKSHPPPGFDPQTTQLVVSRYTD
jgi:hypothetical protein